MGIVRERVELKTPEQIAVMRRSGALLARVHDMLADSLRPGVTTAQLDALAEEMIRDEGAVPNFKGYQGFPATLCISVNEVVVHGIPGELALEEGDVVSIDGGCIVEGWHSDAARTHIVGTPRREADVDLVRITEDALWEGIAALATARRVGEIGAAIEDFVLLEAGESLSHLEGFGGHGIGTGARHRRRSRRALGALRGGHRAGSAGAHRDRRRCRGPGSPRGGHRPRSAGLTRPGRRRPVPHVTGVIALTPRGSRGWRVRWSIGCAPRADTDRSPAADGP